LYFNFYSKEYDSYYRPSLFSEIDTSNPEKNAIIRRFQKNNLLPENLSNVLDIGSGAGENLLNIKKLFPKASLFAIEPSEDSRKNLTANEIQVISADANSDWDKGNEGKYSLIILRHVLEHFLNPVEVLEKIQASLSDDGLLYIAVPNNLRPTKYLESKWFRVVHTYYFNKYSLKNILHKSGLESIKMQEGDDLNNHELFTIARKSQNSLEIDISQDNYEEQKRVFMDGLKNDNKPLQILKSKLLQILGKA
jgi:SAM-dependent methyltransferase